MNKKYIPKCVACLALGSLGPCPPAWCPNIIGIYLINVCKRKCLAHDITSAIRNIVSNNETANITL